MTTSSNFPVKVKRLRQARSLHLRVLADGSVLVTAPSLVPNAVINRFITEHEAWVIEKRATALEKKRHLVASRADLLYRGRKLDFRLSVRSGIKPSVGLENNQLTVTAPSEDDETVRQALEKWFKKQAVTYFKERVPLLCDVVGKEVATVTVRSQRSRWGSCSSRNTISINWRLILTPDWVSDYVIYHELAHLTHMNHSRAFWSLVKSYCPRYKEAEKWLKDHHQLLDF